MPTPAHETFYQRGLCFECTRCNACCRREAGHLFLTGLDLRRLAERLGLSDEAFFLEYCEIVDLHLAQRVSVIADEDGSCVFLGDEGCTVYEDRPLQCRTYPFWAMNLTDTHAWEQVRAQCPGIGNGKRWSRQEIDELVQEGQAERLLDLAEEPKDPPAGAR